MSLLGERLYEEGLDVFCEGLLIAESQRLGDRVLSTFHDHVAHTILQLRQQRAVHNFTLVSDSCCSTYVTRGVCKYVQGVQPLHYAAPFTSTSGTSAPTGHATRLPPYAW